MKAFMLASTKSNSGKTLVTLLLMEILKRNNKIAAFKAGPDYIDPKYHETILGSPSYNLDIPIMGINNVESLYLKHSQDKDLSIIEGVMGLFDGINSKDLDSNGSSFDLAKVLNIPIILLVDCKGKAQSVLAEILGFIKLVEYKEYRISGIILNRTTQRNFEYIKGELSNYSEIPIIGFIPNLDIELESRHLGLKDPTEIKKLKENLIRNSEIITKTINLDQLLNYIDNQKLIEGKNITFKKERFLKVGIALDEAFNFYYKDNLDLLKELGCELIYFSPIHDKKIPENLDLIYFGGGYPELFLEELNRNKSFMNDLKEKLKNGLTCIAECGGFIYLSEKITYQNKSYKGVGIFNCNVDFKNHLVRFGYNDLDFDGIKLKSHEFHYSDIIFKKKPKYLFKITKGRKTWNDGIRFKNTFGFYPHIHFYAQRDGLKFLNFILDLADGSKS